MLVRYGDVCAPVVEGIYRGNLVFTVVLLTICFIICTTDVRIFLLSSARGMRNDYLICNQECHIVSFKRFWRD